MLPWSVMPIAGWPSAAALATSVADPGRAVEHRELGVHVQMGERARPRPGPAPSAALDRTRCPQGCPQAVDDLHSV